MKNPIIFDKVSLTYDKGSDIFVVQDFTLSINQGEFFCLVGPSGCGKSTVLKIIAGLEKPSRGEIKKPETVGMVFQTGALLPWLTVENNIAFAAKMEGFSQEKVESLTGQYLKMVDLEQFRNKYPRELSGGQKQRVGIARALSIESEVLLMDEPFSALDPLTTEELHNDLLQIWQKTKKTIIMVSHLVEEAVLLADRIGIMKTGRLDSIVSVTLPRPRKEEQKEFLPEVEKVRKILHNQ
ncbi:MAG: ABC transporter ATP-binding protein [Patescibacteria group bacterium]|jgi:NitT/TauT family transport system ATP-binding protein